MINNEIIFATNNLNKLKEIRNSIKSDFIIKSLSDIKYFEDIPGITFIYYCVDEWKIEWDGATSVFRDDEILTHPIFNIYHSETEMMRYLKKLENKDIALNRSMIPLGSCTMKLNAASEILPITLPGFANAHPFLEKQQREGYNQMMRELISMLKDITGFDAISLQPNAGAQGEFAGLLAIKKFHESNNEYDRNVCLIPISAHGTNPASAQMCGMEVSIVKCDDLGNVDLNHLDLKIKEAGNKVAALMITYPSKHGVF